MGSVCLFDSSYLFYLIQLIDEVNINLVHTIVIYYNDFWWNLLRYESMAYICVHDRISKFVSLENNDPMKYEVSAICLYVSAKFAKI